MPTTHILYHANCLDGFAAAFAAWCYYGDLHTQYRPLNYGDAVPEDITPDDTVVLLDFTFPRPTLEALRQRVRSILVIDHHSSAQQTLEGLDYAHFDLSHSACVLAWQFFFPSHSSRHHPMPEEFRYIEHRDLGRMWNPAHDKDFLAGNNGCEIICTTLSYVFDRNFKAWAKMLPECDAYLHIGKYILTAQQALITELLKDTHAVRILDARAKCHWVPAVNTATLHSEVGHQLLQKYPNAPFVCTYAARVTNTGRLLNRYSLRARFTAPTVNVAQIAETYGGGGHPQAAGFESLHTLPAARL